MTPKHLLLLRHAKSSWDDPAMADEDRPLAPRGHYAAALMAEHLRGQGLAVDLVLCSMARRTRQTLDHIAPALADIEVRFEHGLYTFDPKPLLDRLRRVPETINTLLLIGHNPGLQDLTLDLASNTTSPLFATVDDKFPTAGLATLTFTGAWSELGPHGAVLTSLIRPKDLGASSDY